MPFSKKNAILIILLTMGANYAAAGSAYSLQEARRVVQGLEKIQKESRSRAGAPLRATDFTESELNSYIAYRIDVEKEQVMKELRLKLFAENRIEGKIFIDLSGQKLPLSLKPQMNLYFEGTFQIQNGYIRLDFQKLFLEERQVPLMLLDIIIYIASKIGNTEATSINDWYLLPNGIKDMRTGPGRVTVFD